MLRIGSADDQSLRRQPGTRGRRHDTVRKHLSVGI
jgi:hypothetical protein